MMITDRDLFKNWPYTVKIFPFFCPKFFHCSIWSPPSCRARSSSMFPCSCLSFQGQTAFSIQFTNLKTLKKTLLYSFGVYTAMSEYPWRRFEQNINETWALCVIAHTKSIDEELFKWSVCCLILSALKLIPQDSECISISNTPTASRDNSWSENIYGEVDPSLVMEWIHISGGAVA